MGFNWVCKAGKEDDVEASQPLKASDDAKAPRQFKGAWYAVLGDGTAPDVAAGCLAFWAPSIAFGWNTSRAFGSKWWKEALKFFLLTSVVWCLIRVAMTVLVTTQCPPAPMGGALVGGPMMGPGAQDPHMSLMAMMAADNEGEHKPCKFKGGKKDDDDDILDAIWKPIKHLFDDDDDDDDDEKDKHRHHHHDKSHKKDKKKNKEDKKKKKEEEKEEKKDKKEEEKEVQQTDVAVAPADEQYDEGQDVEYVDAMLVVEEEDDDEKEDKATSSMATAISISDSASTTTSTASTEDAATQTSTSTVTTSQPMTLLTAATTTKPFSTLDAAMTSLDPTHPVQLSLVNTPQGLRMVDTAGHFYMLTDPATHEWRVDHQHEQLDRCFARIGPFACMLLALAVASSITALMYAAKRRTELRRRFGIQGSFKQDAALWLCCAPCALAQETRTMMHNQVEEGMWQGARNPTSAPTQVTVA